MSRERDLQAYGAESMREFLAAESEPETEMERVIRISDGERTCCASPDCPVWSDDWLDEWLEDERKENPDDEIWRPCSGDRR